jgi:hypothetical protein
MIFLHGGSDFYVGDHVDTRGKENLRVLVDAADGSHVFTVLNDKLLEYALKGVEAVVNIVLVSVATYES